ncbi:hypothetical protein F5148DRAFT_1177323 [Russula earlei]|uniref:Uncharacterized protein n=1 Tax=Russula earlei TaxID=71964 RepID=A0ACC0UHH8_9AGAM|nr:hypothetical protein F5148DRAFT_1177323 [Russula earlei]
MSLSPDISTDVHKQLIVGLNIFHPSRLRTEDDINVAVNVLEGSLDKESIGPIILCSLQPEHPYVFEFIISSVGEECVNLISRFVRDTLPSDIDAFRTSLSYKILSRLSSSLSRLSYPSGQQPENLDNYRRKVEMAPTVLEYLTTLLREGFFDEEAENRAGKRNVHRGRTPRSKVASEEHSKIDDLLFHALGSEAPRSGDEAEETVQSIMDDQTDILEFFIMLLRMSETLKLVRNAYFRENVLQGNLSISDEHANPITSSAMGPPPTSLVPAAEPIQADLYFESATGYGRWRILCSKLCLDKLARDGTQSDPVLKRLEELSLGCFSETNQKRLTKYSPIEIFRARLPGSVRLVYHIDVIHEFGKDILGIFSLDELNRTNWDKFGIYRARKGPDYVAKCRSRSCSHGFYFDPMTFDATITSPGAVFADPDSIENGDIDGVDEIHRLLDLEQYAILSQNVIRDILEGHNYPRVFQVSHEEKKVVECTRSSFILGRSGTGKTTVIVFKIFGIDRAWQNQGCVGPRPRQLFVTKSRLLAEKVERDYVSLLYSLSAAPDSSDSPLFVRERIQRWNSRRKRETFNPDDTDNGRDDLPEKFSELRDSHFPLFLTMDTVSSLLEADMKSSQGSNKSRNFRPQKKDQEWYARTDLVTYDVFKRVYWSRLPLTKGLWTIKGSEKSLEYANRALDRESYEGFRDSHRLDYALFEAYQKLKLKRGERDLADRTHGLLNALKENGLKGDLVDFVYVDEVQDLLLIDTRLIISLCRNPDGLLWAGDTAQTISVGSTFTFKQLGASVYRYQRSIRALRGTPRQPEGFQLLKNYRSHGGIVKCANAIIRLLQRFPSAIDHLQPEAGVVGKELPIFFHGDDLPQGRDIFLSSSGRLMKLGHNQCVIVRDDAARESFKTDIGRVGVTLYDSPHSSHPKVILYNFFEESASENLWNYLMNKDQHKIVDLKYMPLIHELKCLYVAITRAKHRLWIVDYSCTCEPLMQYLLDCGFIVESRTSRHSLEPFVNESTAGEWSEEGNRLLNHREFEEAILAFDNAGDDYMAAVATAYQAQEVARDIPEPETRRRREAFKNAASAFEHCAEIAKSAQEQSSHYAAAARCYADVKCHQDAVRALKLAKMFTEAASYCFDNNLLDTAVSIIKKHEAEVDLDTTESIKQVARMSYLESQELDKALDLFKDNEERMMGFVVEHDLGLTRALILGRDGKYGEAIKQYLDEGQISEAIDLALVHIDDVMKDVKTFNAIVDKALWRYLSFGCREWPESSGIPFDKICMLLKKIQTRNLNDRDKRMLFIFKLNLNDLKPTDFQKITSVLSSRVLRCESLRLDKAVKLLGLDYFFDDMSSALDYSLLIRDAALEKAPWDSKCQWLCTLFQFEKDGEGIRIRPGTFIYEDYIARGFSPSRPAEHLEHSAVSLSREEFTRHLTRLLSERLESRIRNKDRILSQLHLFDPCIQLTLRGRCHLREHTASHELDEGWFNRRARFHLQQIMILDNLHAFACVEFPARINSQRRLLNTLGNALNPLLYLSGSISALNEDLIPEAADGFSTVKRWAFDVLYSLNPSIPALQGAFLTNLCTAITLGRLRQDGGTVNDCLLRIPCTSTPKQRHPRLIVHTPSGSQIYTLYTLLSFMDGSGDLAQGVRFFRYVVREHIPIDLAVMCNIVERLFGLAIMTGKYRAGLHGVVLPRSWVLALWKDFTTFKEKPLAPLWVLAQETERLLRGLYTGEYLNHTIDFSSRDVKNKAPNWSNDLPRKFLQDLCVARICRCLCLLGENFSDLRNDVVRTTESLRTSHVSKSTAFHWRYISAGDWEKLAEVLYQSTPPQFDCLVKLHQRIFRVPAQHPPSVQFIVFEDMNTIPNILRSRPTDPQGHQRRRHTPAAGEIDDPGDTSGGDQRTAELAEYSAQDAADVNDRVEPDRTKEALVIQRAARRYILKGLEDNIDDSLRMGRNRLFQTCKESAKAVHIEYRRFYLGPLPHLLLCLEWIILSAQTSKVAIKARRAEATLQEISDLMTQHKEMR